MFTWILLLVGGVIGITYLIRRISEKKHWERMDKKFPDKKSSGRDR